MWGTSSNPNRQFGLGSITYDNGLAPVPVPPSVLLLGSGLVGLIGLRRVRRS